MILHAYILTGGVLYPITHGICVPDGFEIVDTDCARQAEHERAVEGDQP